MPLTENQVGLQYGFRSGLEEGLCDQLSSLGLPVIYEQFSIPWRLEKDCRYTPDFILPNGVVIESKGRFVTQDRQTHLAIQKQWPELDIRFVFSRSASRISKTSKTTYAKWCKDKGFQFADSRIPQRWIDEPVNPVSLAVVRKLFEDQGKEFPS